MLRVYNNNEKKSKTSKRRESLSEILQLVVIETESKIWTTITLIDMKHKTLIIKWTRGRDGRPQHPLLPGMAHW